MDWHHPRQTDPAVNASIRNRTLSNLPANFAPKPTRKPPLPALTGIRTLLAFNIVLFHFTPPHLGPLYRIVNNGYVFVNVFFLISGYILTSNYATQAATPPHPYFFLAPFSRL